ncbi:hypothetical protein CEH05_02695 [Halobacillus halophilus]|uniref:Uncharacterized protein n=1 Tax=Halobacillus halophilus (strain ATCC 35676 / DSM 2266 / JCM 20832 / KCTC 3685 / LMG 17431 / NBRC 102448 / NCIMB 2269) TaxID=866895 RepID=I0JIB4_HALH3|nr:hypothetical protein [Halobacillus halophilus]ASF38070.1 hypothetical protein CEH05_02695 [Halobacillus halophilus]CCG43882.1 hypothetical protein HBHAL_1511 [Halobacillus halophilus DSM 2266]
MLKNIQEWSLLLVIFGVTSLLGNWLGYDIMPLAAAPGMLVLVLVCLAGFILHRLIPIEFPSVAYIAIIGVLISMPWMPGSDYIVAWTNEVELLALTTPILAYAGIAIGRSWTDFVRLGWRTIVVASLVLLGTFLGSAMISELILSLQGII